LEVPEKQDICKNAERKIQIIVEVDKGIQKIGKYTRKTYGGNPIVPKTTEN